MELTVGTREPPKIKISNKGMSGFMQEERFNCIKIKCSWVGEKQERRLQMKEIIKIAELGRKRSTSHSGAKGEKSLPSAHG